MFGTMFRRIFGRNNAPETAAREADAPRTSKQSAPTKERSAPATSPQEVPVTTPPTHPDYTILNEAVRLASIGEHRKADAALRQAHAALSAFPLTCSLYLAGATLVNAIHSNFGTAGDLAEKTARQFHKDGTRLAPDERHFVMSALSWALETIPIDKLENGTRVVALQQQASALREEVEFGKAAVLLREAVRIVRASTCLRLHALQLYAALDVEINRTYAMAAEHACRYAQQLCKGNRYGMAVYTLGQAARFVSPSPAEQQRVQAEIERVCGLIAKIKDTSKRANELHIADTGQPLAPGKAAPTAAT